MSLEAVKKETTSPSVVCLARLLHSRRPGSVRVWRERGSLRNSNLHRVDDVAAMMDDAAVALERFHWSLRRSIDTIADDAPEIAESQRRLSAVDQAQAHASSLGSRLAIRLGPREQSELVSVYVDFQNCYRALANAVLTSPATAAATSLRSKLDRLANHDRYFETALRTRAYLEQRGRLLRGETSDGVTASLGAGAAAPLSRPRRSYGRPR
jgi:hypothetical protein